MRHFFILIMLIVGTQVFAQKSIVWFDAGIKAQYGATGFYNQAIADSRNYEYNIATGYSIGGKLGINWRYNGLAIDIMSSNASQTFDRDGSANLQTINWKALDVYALFRHAKNLGYFEIGPKISFVNSVEDDIEGGFTDRTADYNENNIAGVIGFGANIMGNDGRFSGILGLRFEYGLTDFVGDTGAAASVNAPLRNPTVYADGYKSSNVAFAGVVFELNWGIGYFGKAQCGARSKFIMF